MRHLFEMLAERNDVSSDPYDRARERMLDAQDRGGWSGMIDATLRRVKATADRDKLRGIIDVATDMKKRLDSSDANQARRAKQLDSVIAAAKRKLTEAVEMSVLLRDLAEARAGGPFSDMPDRQLDDAIMNCLEGPEGVYMDGEYTGPIAPRMRKLRKHYRELSPQQQDDLYNRVRDCL